MKRPTRKELLKLLRRAEISLANAKIHNPWTTGANDTLKEIGAALTAEERSVCRPASVKPECCTASEWREIESSAAHAASSPNVKDEPRGS